MNGNETLEIVRKLGLSVNEESKHRSQFEDGAEYAIVYDLGISPDGHYRLIYWFPEGHWQAARMVAANQATIDAAMSHNLDMVCP